MQESVLERIRGIFKAKNVFIDEKSLREKSHDSWPANLFQNDKERRLPSVVVRPDSGKCAAQLQELVRLARTADPKLKIIARGGGSGVCGAANCIGGEIVVDMTGLKHIGIIRWPENGKNGLMRCEPGVSGAEIDAAIKSKNARFSCKHYPASYYVSTVGGWIQTNASGHFGRVSEFVERVEGVNGKGEFVSLAGEELKKVLGMEGMTLLVTAVYLPIFALPAYDGFLTLRFDFVEDVADFLRYLHAEKTAFASGLGVNILTARFYDWFDYSFIAKPHRGDSYKPGWYKRLEYAMEKQLCRAGPRTSGLRGFFERRRRMPWTGVLYMVADTEEQIEDARGVLEAKCAEFDGRSLGPTTAKSWYDHRFKLGYDKLVSRFKIGIVADTFDCTPSWDTLVSTYENVREAAFRQGIAGAHIALDREGPYIYFTFATAKKNLKEYSDFWENLLRTCAKDKRARTNHHHGIGKLKAGEIGELAQYAYGLEWYAFAHSAKREMDPDNVLNPNGFLKYAQ